MWVEILDPTTKRPFFAETESGDSSWTRPENVGKIVGSAEIDWWELFDDNHQLPYYYNTTTGQTEWTRPKTGYIISLALLQKKSGSSGFPTPAPSASPSSHIPHPHLQALSFYPTSNYMMRSDSSPSTPAAVTPIMSQMKISPAPSSAAPEPPFVSAPQTPVSVAPIAAAAVSHSEPVKKALPYNLKSDIGQFKIEGFAQQFFSTHKRGIFRKRVPIDQMLVFTKDAIPSPLMNVNKDLHKEAIKCFKGVQKVMGDRPTKLKNPDEIQELLLVGINKGELRDELYCQVLKQLSENPRPESIIKGWELLACIVVTFPPSKNFEGYLQKFMHDNTTNAVERIVTFAKHCLIKLERICQKGPRGKVPTIPEIERAKESPFFPSVFGESLADIMIIQQEKEPNLKLPRIMTFLADSILKLNGCQTEGIFRVPGDADAVTELRLRLEKGQYDISGISDASVPGSLFKFWLRDLTDPIIPHDLYDYCIKNAEKADMALQVIDKIPENNRNVLLYLISFLQIIAETKNQPVTRMSVNNVAMVFAPNILRCPSDNLQVILENTKYEQAFVRTLITHLVSDAVHTMH